MANLSESPQSSKSNHSIIEVLEFCKVQNLPARVVGRWVWVEFENKPEAEIRQALKDFGFRWSRRRGDEYSLGWHTLSVTAWDSRGLWATSQVVNVEVWMDDPPPP